MTNETQDTAALLRRLLDDLERQESTDEPEGGVRVLRSVTDQHQHTDTVSGSTSSTSAWDWSESSEWGFDSW